MEEDLKFVLQSFNFVAKQLAVYSADRQSYITTNLELANEIKSTYDVANPKIQWAIDVLMANGENEIIFTHNK